MPRYFFHVRAHDDRLIEDHEGLELADDATAFTEALASSHDMASEAVRARQPVDKCIVVTDEAGGVLRTVTLLTVIE